MNSLEIEILLVEDSPADIELTLHALRQNCVVNRIHVARDGEEALDFIFRRGSYESRLSDDLPKLILLDLRLPKVDGIEVLRAIKSHEATKLIPLVVLTSCGEEADLVSSYRLGVNSYIQKPVDFAQFREIVQQLGLYWLVVNEPPPSYGPGCNHASIVTYGDCVKTSPICHSEELSCRSATPAEHEKALSAALVPRAPSPGGRG